MKWSSFVVSERLSLLVSIIRVNLFNPYKRNLQGGDMYKQKNCWWTGQGLIVLVPHNLSQKINYLSSFYLILHVLVLIWKEKFKI